MLLQKTIKTDVADSIDHSSQFERRTIDGSDETFTQIVLSSSKYCEDELHRSFH